MISPSTDKPSSASPSLGKLLTFVNWITPKYQQKARAAGHNELNRLYEVAQILRKPSQAEKTEVLSIAHSVKDWTQFESLPYQIRAAVEYALQTRPGRKSVGRIELAEFFRSVTRFFTGQRVSQVDIEAKLKNEVGLALLKLGDAAAWSALEEICQGKVGQFGDLTSAIDYYTEIKDATGEEFKKFLNEDEWHDFELRMQTGTQREMGYKIRKKMDDLLVVDFEKVKGKETKDHDEWLALKNKTKNREAYRDEAVGIVQAEEGEIREKARTNEEKAFKKMLFQKIKNRTKEGEMQALEALRRHKRQPEVSIEEIAFRMEKDKSGVWQGCHGTLDKTWILQNDKKRKEGISFPEQEFQDLSSEEKKLLRVDLSSVQMEKAARKKAREIAGEITALVFVSLLIPFAVPGFIFWGGLLLLGKLFQLDRK
jgi:hypothetical protein